MQKRFIAELLVVVMFLSGCGSSGGRISQSDYDKVVKERDAIQAELNDLKEDTVPKEQYEAVVDERDSLSKELSDYIQSSEEKSENVDEEHINSDEPANISEEDNVEVAFPKCPISFDDCGFTHYSIQIDSFDAKAENSYGNVKISYTISGVTDNTNGNAFLKVYCYDADAYSVDTSQIRLSNAQAGEPFKIKDEMLVDASTARIEFGKP